MRAPVMPGSKRWFRFKVALARALGLWKYDGLTGWQPRHWPRARVYYPEVQQYSRPLALGDAIDQADMHAKEGCYLSDTAR